MAISQLHNRLKRIDWALIESMKAVREEAELLTQTGELAIKINPIQGTSRVDVAVFRRDGYGSIVGNAYISRCINVTQPRSVITEILDKMLRLAGTNLRK
jgi:hypothetical protein